MKIYEKQGVISYPVLMADDRKTVTLKNPTLIAHLSRLVNTGLYGNKETDAAEKLIAERIEYLLESGRLESIEKHGTESREIAKFVEQGRKTGEEAS